MLLLIIIVACILLLLTYLVVTVRRHDKRASADRDRDPFYQEMARLAAAGLLYEEEERKAGRLRHSYIVTPAGEAALRTWLREPMNDPGLLRLYFAGIVAPADVVALAREQRQRHEEHLDGYKRVESLFGRKKGWDEERKRLALGQRFEKACIAFWERQADEPFNKLIQPQQCDAAPETKRAGQSEPADDEPATAES